MIWPAPGVTGAILLEQLKSAAAGSQYGNVFHGGNRTVRESYLEWVGNTERQLRAVMMDRDVEHLLLSARYRALLGSTAETAGVKDAIRREVETCHRSL